ncbi:RxLR effector protein [Phytophthora megakarya]|uniref:RxLR effector protein n=1 Tax=Phytophthora megakarya TaxID=4795 RepID=A0A225X1D1_9STRA|nr:RxLR effector protein [Phytophthora megakarya]
MEEYQTQWKRIWSILCSVCITILWMQRNRVVHQAGPMQLKEGATSQALQCIGQEGTTEATHKSQKYSTSTVRTIIDYLPNRPATPSDGPCSDTGNWKQDTGVDNLAHDFSDILYG